MACASSTAPSTKTKTSYADDAQAAYEQALIKFRKKDCVVAEPEFRRVAREYPYSRFAALAELRIADCSFKDGNYSAAIQGYRQFVRQRPSHSQVSYARFRIAEAFYEQIPSSWALAPPSYERDQGAARDALTQLRRFVVDYPEDARRKDADKMIQRCLKLLADHELAIGKFYMRRDALRAVVARMKTLLATYQGSGVEAEAMWLLSRAYLGLKDRKEARDTMSELVESYPDSDEAKKARGKLKALGPAGG